MTHTTPSVRDLSPNERRQRILSLLSEVLVNLALRCGHHPTTHDNTEHE